MASIPELRLPPSSLAVMPYLDNLWLVPIPIQKAMRRSTPIPTESWDVDVGWVTKSKSPVQDDAAKAAGGANRFAITLGGGAEFSARVHVELNNVYSATAGDRDALRQDFVAFRQLLDSLEQQENGLAAGAARTLAASVAETIPVLIAPQETADGLLYESLFFRYGLQPFQVDLHPGMRLRVDYGVNQFVPPAESLLNGYTGGAVGHFTVATNHVDRKLTFNTFLNQIGPLQIDRQGTAAISSELDLTDARRHYRLFYPRQLASTTSRNHSIQANATLVGSDDLKKLDSAYPTQVDDGEILYSTFRRRAAVTPEIGIFLNGQPQHVTLGTTVRQVIEGTTNWSGEQIFRATLNAQLTDTKTWPDQALFVDRYWGTSVLGTRSPEQYRRVQIVFIPNREDLTGTSLFDLPLVQGDSVRLG